MFFIFQREKSCLQDLSYPHHTQQKTSIALIKPIHPIASISFSAARWKLATHP